MKRYSMHTGSPRKPLASMVKHPCGEYVKLADVEREYIPRPDPEEARKAVEDFREACVSVGFAFGGTDEHFYAKLMKEAEAAVLKHMGVE